MDCVETTGSVPGLLVGLDTAEKDSGKRPTDIAFWASPNIRMVPAGDIKPDVNGEKQLWRDPAYWEGKNFVTETLEVGRPYRLVVRLRDTDSTYRTRLNLQAWVAGLNAGAPGPGTAIRDDDGNPVSFTVIDKDYSVSEVFPQDSTNPGNPAKMGVLVAEEVWTPTEAQLADNKGHHCLILNVWANQSSGEGGSPQDGASFTGAYLSPPCNRRHAQRNLNIIARQRNTVATRNVMVGVPATDRCVLEAEVALKQIELQQRDPQLVGLATSAGLTEHHCPTKPDPMEGVSIDDCGDPSHEVGICVRPGEQKNLAVTVAPYEGEKVGDIYAFDMITTEESNDSIYGAARFYVMVTA